MRFRFSEEEESFRKRVCKFLQKEVTPELFKQNRDPLQRDGVTWACQKTFIKKLADEGLIGVGWPKEYGGGGKGLYHEVILKEELHYHLAPGFGWTNMPGYTLLPPAIIAICSEEQKRFFLPKIRAGEIFLWAGYSEPEAGSDVANLQSKAVLDGDSYVLSGEKLFASHADTADYGWILARTDPNAPKKQQGLSLFIVDMKLPGVSIVEHSTIAGWNHAAVFFDGVRVPKNMLVGELNKGFYNLMKALEYEHAWVSNPGPVLRTFDEIMSYCKTTLRDGRPLLSDPLIRNKLAKAAIEVEATRLVTYRIGSLHDKGQGTWADSVLSHIVDCETSPLLDDLAAEILGPYAQVRRGSPLAPADGFFSQRYLHDMFHSFAAGGLDVNRNNLATGRAGLGMPRPL